MNSENYSVMDCEQTGLTPQERAQLLLKHFTVQDNGLIAPCDAVELQWFIERAIVAAIKDK